MIVPRFSRSILLALLVAGAALAQDLPKRDRMEKLDFEPKLMLNDLPDMPLPDGGTPTSLPGATALEVTKLETELARAKKNAVWRARLCKAGVLSKMEAEQSVLKVVRVTRDLEAARLAAATQEVAERRKRKEAGELSAEALEAAEAALAAAAGAEREAATKWDEAQRSAAELRLERERKLLAAGAGSRSAVRRAETALQSLTTPPPR